MTQIPKAARRLKGGNGEGAASTSSTGSAFLWFIATVSVVLGCVSLFVGFFWNRNRTESSCQVAVLPWKDETEDEDPVEDAPAPAPAPEAPAPAPAPASDPVLSAVEEEAERLVQVMRKMRNELEDGPYAKARMPLPDVPASAPEPVTTMWGQDAYLAPEAAPSAAPLPASAVCLTSVVSSVQASPAPPPACMSSDQRQTLRQTVDFLKSFETCVSQEDPETMEQIGEVFRTVMQTSVNPIQIGDRLMAEQTQLPGESDDELPVFDLPEDDAPSKRRTKIPVARTVMAPAAPPPVPRPIGAAPLARSPAAQIRTLLPLSSAPSGLPRPAPVARITAATPMPAPTAAPVRTLPPVPPLNPPVTRLSMPSRAPAPAPAPAVAAMMSRTPIAMPPATPPLPSSALSVLRGAPATVPMTATRTTAPATAPVSSVLRIPAQAVNVLQGSAAPPPVRIPSAAVAVLQGAAAPPPMEPVPVLGAFDATRYVQFHADLRALNFTEEQAQRHYAEAGIRERRIAFLIGWTEGGIWSDGGYLDAHADVKRAGVSAQDHYRSSGWRERRSIALVGPKTRTPQTTTAAPTVPRPAPQLTQTSTTTATNNDPVQELGSTTDVPAYTFLPIGSVRTITTNSAAV